MYVCPKSILVLTAEQGHLILKEKSGMEICSQTGQNELHHGCISAQGQDKCNFTSLTRTTMDRTCFLLAEPVKYAQSLWFHQDSGIRNIIKKGD